MFISKKQKNNSMDKKNSVINQMLRVNHAGELAAKYIYQGQIDFINDEKSKAIIKEMAEGEQEHLEFFENEISQRKARPTLLVPLVKTASYILGAVSAKLGAKSAMACTMAVEEVISNHYQEQINQIKKYPQEGFLLEKIEKFKNDEQQHHDIAQINDGENAAMYGLFSGFVKLGCKVAINLVKIF